MISLNVYQRLARGSAHYANITPYAPDWRRTTRAIGGYMAGSFTAAGLSRTDMLEWYDRFLGCRIVETTAGIVSWEGMIYEMRLILDGVEYCRTLDSEWFHNRIRVIYSASSVRSFYPTTPNMLLTPGFETAGGGGADIWADWTENAGDGALADETVIVQSGGHAAKLTTEANMLLTPGFETAGGGGADIWASWTESAGDGALADETVIVQSGGHAAKMTAGPSANTYVSQALSVTAEKEYNLTFYTRGNGTHTGRYGVYDNTNSAWIRTLISTGVSGTSYEFFDTAFTTPAGCVSVTIYFYCPTTNTAVAYFDDIFVAGTSADTYVSQSLTVLSGVTYSLKFYARGDGTYAGRYGVYDNTYGAWITAVKTTGVTGAAYALVSATFTVPPGCTSVAIRFYCSATNVGYCYVDTISVVAPAWSENLESIDEYGAMNYLEVQGAMTADAAGFLATRHLGEFAWPRSRMAGGIALGRSEHGADSLVVYCLGYWTTLGWRYQESNLAAGNASAHISTLVAASEFVTDGRVESNTMSVVLNVSSAARLSDLIGDVIRQGDAEGNVWQGGVYAGRKFVYEQAPTAASHYLRNGVLVDRASRPVVPSLLLPGFLLQNSAAPVAGQPPGTSEAWDDPRVAYVEEVEFERPDVLRLKVQEIEETVSIIASQLARGTNLFLGGQPEIRPPWDIYPPKDYKGKG